MTPLKVDPHIADPQLLRQFVVLVLLAFAADRVTDVAPQRPVKVKAARPTCRRRRDIRPPRAC